MDKNKLVITIMVLLIFLALAIGIFILMSPNKQPTVVSSSTYNVSITEMNKNITSKLTSNGTEINLNQNDLTKYAIVTFNNPHDIMIMECPEGYTLANPTSSTGNKITEIKPLNQVNIEITPGKQNNLAISCSKN